MYYKIALRISKFFLCPWTIVNNLPTEESLSILFNQFSQFPDSPRWENWRILKRTEPTKLDSFSCTESSAIEV